MQQSPPASSPDAYVAALSGWQRKCVETLRGVVISANPKLTETIKWGHLVYLSNGPVLLIRAEDQRVLFGFWRGQQLQDIEPRLKPGGKYEMATMELTKNTALNRVTVRQLVEHAVALNRSLGDPTKVPVSRASSQ